MRPSSLKPSAHQETWCPKPTPHSALLSTHMPYSSARARPSCFPRAPKLHNQKNSVIKTSIILMHYYKQKKLMEKIGMRNWLWHSFDSPQGVVGVSQPSVTVTILEKRKNSMGEAFHFRLWFQRCPSTAVWSRSFDLRGG